MYIQSAPSRCTRHAGPAVRHAGFSLIELMVVVVVVAILASIAVPTYTAQTRKSRRTEARSALLDLAGREERYLSVANSYSQVPTDLNYPAATPSWPQTIGGGYYQVTVSAPLGLPTPTYSITATAIGSQTSDTACASLNITNLGQQKSTDSGGVVTNSNSPCWN